MSDYLTLWDTCDPEAEAAAEECGDIDDMADDAYDEYIQLKCGEYDEYI